MPQIQLPIFPSQSTAITSELAFEEREGTVWYFNGHLPVFSHPVDDIESFRFFSSQLIANGNASQSEIARRAAGEREAGVQEVARRRGGGIFPDARAAARTKAHGAAP